MKKKQLKLHLLKHTICVFEISKIIGGKDNNKEDSLYLLGDSIKLYNAYQSRDGEFHRDTK